MFRTGYFLILLAAASGSATAQWLNYAAAGTPRTKDGKPNLSAPAPRASNGKPDLSGIWEAEGAPLPELLKYLPDGGVNGLGEDAPSRYFFNILGDFKPEEAPVRPEALQRWQQAAAHPEAAFCLPVGVPLADTAPAPHKVVQTPGLVLMLYELDTSFRQIYTDGRKLPADPQPAWMGYSVGHWEGYTLVVESAGFNDKTALDAMGHVHSEALHVTERFHRRDFGHLDLEITLDDPKSFTRPFTVKQTQRLLPDTDLIETVCTENEKDARHMAAK